MLEPTSETAPWPPYSCSFYSLCRPNGPLWTHRHHACPLFIMLLGTTALYRPWPSQAFSSSRLKNPESHKNISTQSINLSIFPPLLIIKMLLYDMVPQSEEVLAVTPVTGRKLLSHCPVGHLQCSCCHPPIKGMGASSVLPKWLCLLYVIWKKVRREKKTVCVKYLSIKSEVKGSLSGSKGVFWKQIITLLVTVAFSASPLFPGVK